MAALPVQAFVIGPIEVAREPCLARKRTAVNRVKFVELLSLENGQHFAEPDRLCWLKFGQWINWFC